MPNDYLSEKEFLPISTDAEELMKIIRSIILSCKQKSSVKKATHNS